MTYFKCTVSIPSLLEMGYPHLDFCEVDGDRVVRRIQGWGREIGDWGAGKLVKESLEGASVFRTRKGLRESVRETSQNEPDGDFLVEELTRIQFEEVWAKAEAAPKEWLD